MSRFYANGTITDIEPEGYGPGIELGDESLHVTTDNGDVVFEITDNEFTSYEIYWKNNEIYNSEYCLFDIIAAKIPLDILETCDTQVFEYLLKTVADVFDGLSNHIDTMRSRLLGGKSANN